MDTIVAISTALGEGAISIIRLSGSEALEILDKIFSRDVKKLKSHTINYGYIKDQDEIIDEVLVSIMKSPKTYTREDIVEINCHGGISSSKKILELCLKEGARMALPGEFTKRAFINGRIDLLEAEGVNDLLESNSEISRKTAVNKVSGKLSRKINSFRDELLNILADIEVNIDYPEYTDIYETTNENIKKELKNIEKNLRKIVKESEEQMFIKSGIKTAIIGRPNVGKSSILNKLLDYEKAIVTDIEGTTRDIVEGTITISGINLNLLDTAGIRDTDNKIEKLGVNKSLEEIKNADLVILVLSNNEELNDIDKELLDKSKDKKRIIVVNKTDLEEKLVLPDLDNVIYINTIEDDKINILKEKIEDLFNLGELKQSDLLLFSNLRQINLAKETLVLLEDLKDALKNEYPIDIVAIDIKNIYEKLSEIVGEYNNLAVIDRIFERFCVGK